MSYKWESELHIETQHILIQLNNYRSIYKGFNVLMAKLFDMLVQILANVALQNYLYFFIFPVFSSIYSFVSRRDDESKRVGK